MRRWLDGNLLRDVGILLFLVCVIGIVLLVSFAPADMRMPYLLMTCIAFMSAALAFFGRESGAIILAGTQVGGWTAYKLYALYGSGVILNGMDYLWLIAPLLLTGSVCLFQYGSSQLERENALLRTQVEDLVMIDALTGLYNLRALYRDLPSQSRYCVRHSAPLSLLIIQLRYEQELHSFLNKRRFDALRDRMASLVRDELRVEDRLYAIDESGTLAAMLVTDYDGTMVVKNRLRSLLEDPNAFQGITDDNIIVSVRMAFRMCDDELGKRPVDFKLSVEQELQYDV